MRCSCKMKTKRAGYGTTILMCMESGAGFGAKAEIRSWVCVDLNFTALNHELEAGE